MGFKNSCPAVRRRRAKNKYSSFFSKDIPNPEPEPESSMEKIYPSLSELFQGSLKDPAPILRNMDARELQQLNNDRGRLEQKAREMERSLGLALQAIQRLETITQGMENGKPKGEPEKATIGR